MGVPARARETSTVRSPLSRQICWATDAAAAAVMGA